VADLKEYRHRLAEAGEKKADLYAYMALKDLKGEESPAESLFLLSLCFVSLREMMKALAEQQTANDTGVES
jgi:hypothetical protein